MKDIAWGVIAAVVVTGGLYAAIVEVGGNARNMDR
jgi:hypothetical protein